MSVRREHKVAGRLDALLDAHPGLDPDRNGPMDGPIVPGLALTRRTAVRIFESCLQSRAQDFEARRMKDEGRSYYTIGSSGHEGSASVAAAARPTDMAFLHYHDRPGVVGIVGRVLGEGNVNIGGMQVSRDESGHALIVLTVDSAISPEQLEAIITEIGAHSGKSVDLD